jgi:hypothetical protein
MSLRFAAILLFSTLSWLAALGKARADVAPGTVVLFVAEGAGALGRRVRQEVESLGLVVSSRPADAMTSPSLDNELLRSGVVAVIRVTPAAVEIALLKKTDGSTVHRKRVAPSAGEPSSAELLATQTVEILRANLIAVPAEPYPAVPAAAVPTRPPRPGTVPPKDERSHDIALLAGPAVVGSDAFTPSGHVLASVTYLSPLRLGATAAALFPVVPAHLSEPEGSVDLFPSIYRVTALYQPDLWSSSLFLRFSIGIALEHLRWQGAANAPNLSAVEDVFAWSPTGGLAAGVRLAANLRVVGEATLLVGYPRTVVRLAGRDVTAWGRPAGTASIGIELSLPFSTSPRVDAASASSSASR